MACLKETVVQKLLEPMMNAVTSAERTFSRGGAVRSALTLKLLDCICAVAVRLGTDAASQVFQSMLSNYQYWHQYGLSEQLQGSLRLSWRSLEYFVTARGSFEISSHSNQPTLRKFNNMH